MVVHHENHDDYYIFDVVGAEGPSWYHHNHRETMVRSDGTIVVGDDVDGEWGRPWCGTRWWWYRYLPVAVVAYTNLRQRLGKKTPWVRRNHVATIIRSSVSKYGSTLRNAITATTFVVVLPVVVPMILFLLV